MCLIHIRVSEKVSYSPYFEEWAAIALLPNLYMGNTPMVLKRGGAKLPHRPPQARGKPGEDVGIQENHWKIKKIPPKINICPKVV